MTLVVKVAPVVMRKGKMDMKDLIITKRKNQRFRSYMYVIKNIIFSIKFISHYIAGFNNE
jgi:hypothetical protein